MEFTECEDVVEDEPMPGLELPFAVLLLLLLPFPIAMHVVTCIGSIVVIPGNEFVGGDKEEKEAVRIIDHKVNAPNTVHQQAMACQSRFLIQSHPLNEMRTTNWIWQLFLLLWMYRRRIRVDTSRLSHADNLYPWN